MTKRTIVVSIIAVAALGVAAAFGAVAYHSAQAAATAAQEVAGFNLPAFASQTFSFNMGDDMGRGPGGGFSDEDLAAALGISVDDLTAAYQKANQAALDEAVSKGLITQAQADELKNKGTAFPIGRNWKGWLSQNGIDYPSLLAEALGITVEKLQAAQATAFNSRLDQAVANGNLTQEQADLLKGEYALRSDSKFQSSMQTAFENAVKQAVTDGVITQAQADQILANKAGKGLWGFGGMEMGGRHGGRGFGGPEGFEGPGRWGNDFNNQAPATATPSNNG